MTDGDMTKLTQLVKEYHYDPEGHLYVFVHWDDLPEFVKLIKGSGNGDSGNEFEDVQINDNADICFYDFDYILDFFDVTPTVFFPKEYEG